MEVTLHIPDEIAKTRVTSPTYFIRVWKSSAPPPKEFERISLTSEGLTIE